jgi:hypothetical protein
MERGLETVQIGDARLTAAPCAYPRQRLPEETFRMVLWVHVTAPTTQSENPPNEIQGSRFQ